MSSAGTTRRSIRVSDTLWDAAQEKAERTGESVTSVLVTRLTAWVDEAEIPGDAMSLIQPAQVGYAYAEYGKRQDEFGALCDTSRAEVIGHSHATALMMNEARDLSPTPVKGMPATIHLQSDSLAAVVVRVNAKSITVARVTTDSEARYRINDEREPYPCWAEPGIVTDVVGTPERYAKVVTSDGSVRYRNGSISLTLGKSVSVTDYRY